MVAFYSVCAVQAEHASQPLEEIDDDGDINEEGADADDI